MTEHYSAEKSPKIYRSIGLMSGTSMDGVDSAIIETDGEKITRFGQTHFKSYPGWLKLKIRKLISDIQGDPERKSLDEFYVKEVEREITRFHAEVVEELLINADLRPAEVDVIGFHGHTVDHRPHEKFTWQIGDGAFLAEKTKIDVICNFRRNDVEHGGQGAPLLPLYHKAVVPEDAYPAAVINIGGVSNVTYMDGDNLIAFDTGPGNALIDDIIFENTGRHFDDEGKIAESGRLNEEFLNVLMDNLYFSRKPPKSLDRNQFSNMVSDFLQGKYKDMSFADKVTTLSEFTVQAICKARDHFPQQPRNWFICGGGIHNKYFLRRLRDICGEEVKVRSIKKVSPDLDAEFIEAQGFAFLAVKSLLNKPITFASTTGVKSNGGKATGGMLFKA